MNATYQQYRNAYPQLPYSQSPCAANGYGWHGNGYGWQLDPLKWTAPGSCTEQAEVIAEPVLTSQKVEASTAWQNSNMDEEQSRKLKFEWDYLGKKHSKRSFSIQDALNVPTYKSNNYRYPKLAIGPSNQSGVSKSCDESSSLLSLIDGNQGNADAEEYMKLFSCLAGYANTLKSTNSSKASTSTKQALHKPQHEPSNSSNARTVKQKKRSSTPGERLDVTDRDKRVKSSFIVDLEHESILEKEFEEFDAFKTDLPPETKPSLKSKAGDIKIVTPAAPTNENSNEILTTVVEETNVGKGALPNPDVTKYLLESSEINIERITPSKEHITKITPKSNNGAHGLSASLSPKTSSGTYTVSQPANPNLLPCVTDSIADANIKLKLESSYAVLPSISNTCNSSVKLDVSDVKLTQPDSSDSLNTDNTVILNQRSDEKAPQFSPKPSRTILIDAQVSETNMKMSDTEINKMCENLKVSRSLSCPDMKTEGVVEGEMLNFLCGSIKAVSEYVDTLKTNSVASSTLTSTTSKLECSNIHKFVPLVYGCRPVEPTPVTRRCPTSYKTEVPSPNMQKKMISNKGTDTLIPRHADFTGVLPTTTLKIQGSQTPSVYIIKSTRKLKQMGALPSRIPLIKNGPLCKITNNFRNPTTNGRPFSACSVETKETYHFLQASHHPVSQSKSSNSNNYGSSKTLYGKSNLPVPTKTRNKINIKPTTGGTNILKLEDPKTADDVSSKPLSNKDSYILTPKRASSCELSSNKCIPVLIPSQSHSIEPFTSSTTILMRKPKNFIESQASMCSSKAEEVITSNRPEIHQSIVNQTTSKLSLHNGKSNFVEHRHAASKSRPSKRHKRTKKKTSLAFAVSQKKANFNTNRKPVLKRNEKPKSPTVTKAVSKIHGSIHSIKASQSKCSCSTLGSNKNQRRVCTELKNSQLRDVVHLTNEPDTSKAELRLPLKRRSGESVSFNETSDNENRKKLKTCLSLKDAKSKTIRKLMGDTPLQKCVVNCFSIEDNTNDEVKHGVKEDPQPSQLSKEIVPIESITKVCNLSMKKLENATFSIGPSSAQNNQTTNQGYSDRPGNKAKTHESPCICKKIASDLIPISLRKHINNTCSKNVSLNENVVIDLFKPYIEESLNTAQSSQSFDVTEFVSALSMRLSEKETSVDVESNELLSKPSTAQELVNEEHVRPKCAHSKQQQIRKFSEKIPYEGAKSNVNRVQDLSIQIERRFSKRNTCLRKSKVRKAAKEIDPTDIIKQIKTIRKKLAEASKTNSNVVKLTDKRTRKGIDGSHFLTFEVCRVSIFIALYFQFDICM